MTSSVVLVIILKSFSCSCNLQKGFTNAWSHLHMFTVQSPKWSHIMLSTNGMFCKTAFTRLRITFQPSSVSAFQKFHMPRREIMSWNVDSIGEPEQRGKMQIAVIKHDFEYWGIDEMMLEPCCALKVITTVVQRNFSPDNEVFYMLYERYLSTFSMTFLKQHV